MSVSSHRKLAVEQLINLAQVYWDDPGKLMEISEAAESRMDPATQLLFGAVSNRLERLQREPARALAESTPDLAKLIAERLGKAPPEKPGSTSGAETKAEQPEKRKSRRLPLVLAGLLTVAVLGTWFFWPKSKEETKTAAVGAPGIEILEEDARTEEEAKRGSGPSLLRGRRDAEFPRRAVDPEDDDVTKPLPGGRMPAQPRVTEIKEPKEAPAARASAARAPAGAGERPSAARGVSTGSGVAQRSTGTPPSAVRVPPSAGIAIAEAQLECYLSDSRPTACGEPPAGGRGAAAGGGGGGGSAPPAPASATGAAIPPPGSAASASGSPRASSSAQSARGETSGAGAGGGGGGRSGGGGSGAGDSSGGAASSPSGGRPAAAGGGGGGASPPASQRPPAQPANQPDPPAAPDPDCPEQAQPGRVVFIFDGSVSMGLPLGLDPAEEDRLDESTRRRDPQARAEYRALLQQPGAKRMGRAQLAFSEATQDLPDQVELGLVVFQECRDIRQVGIFGAGRREPAIDYVRSMIPRGRTPLAQSLMVAQEMLDTAQGSIVLLTDGREFCNGDPCAVAEHVKATRPGVPIHIIDIAGQGRTGCVAEITGGRSYAPSEADDLSRTIRAAFRGAAAHCPDTR